MPLRVLTVLNYYHPYISGVSEYARLIAEDLAARDIEVTVLTGQHRADLPETDTLEGVRIVRAKPFAFLHKGYLSIDLAWKYFRMSRQADVVHFHLPMLESGLFAWLTPRRTPLVVTYHCDVTPSSSGSWIDKLAVFSVRASCRWCVRCARSIVVTSLDYARQSEVLRGLENKLKEIFPPDKAPATALERRPLAGAGDPARVGFLGRFVEEKGIDVLLDAVPLVLERLPETKFVLAGDYAAVAGGSLMDRFRERLVALRDHVEVLGKLDEKDLFPFYRSLDLFLLPSVNSYEAFGLVQVEAMKSGVPVIASDLRGVRVPVQATGNGAVVPPRNAVALADAIVAHLTRVNRPTVESISSRAWEVFPLHHAGEEFAALMRAIGQGTA